ncbi:hypothetical protein [uncultured Lentibacter sp.]|jgi:hypothetical protein|uniref:hypothetical protein n=1 Tax=uncultured Lentibacter sp. TaxID=1659309 RepID=UPI00263257A9|nr:hypothetical protein [uncultured Lentibacter sp.]
MKSDVETIRDVVLRERRLAVSDREWKHRLRGYGYGIRESAQGAYVTSVLRGTDLCALAG